MRILSGLFISSAVLLSSLIAQTRPAITGSFGNVVFPGGTAAQGVQRSFGNVAFPGTGGPKISVPFSITDRGVMAETFGRVI